MEANIEQIQMFEDDICGSAKWNGKDRFDQFVWMLRGNARTQWKNLMKEGSDLWDKKDNTTNKFFRIAVGEWIKLMTDDGTTVHTQLNHVRSLRWATTFEKGKYVDPKKYWERVEVIYRLLEIYGIKKPKNDDVLSDEYFSLPECLRDYFKDEVDGTGADVFDTKNGGTGAWDVKELFTSIRKWWKKGNNNVPDGVVNYNNGYNNGGNNNGGNNNGGNNNNNGTNGRGNNGGGNNNRRGGKRKRGGGDNNDRRGNGADRNQRPRGDYNEQQCPLHGGHKWGNCRLNYNNKEVFNLTQAQNWFKRNQNRRGEFGWWFAAMDRKFGNNNNTGGSNQQFYGGPPQQYGGHQNASFYLQPPPGNPPSFNQLPPPPPPPQRPPHQPSSYASLSHSSETPSRTYNPQYGQWM